jgi:hypothetical protein
VDQTSSCRSSKCDPDVFQQIFRLELTLTLHYSETTRCDPNVLKHVLQAWSRRPTGPPGVIQTSSSRSSIPELTLTLHYSGASRCDPEVFQQILQACSRDLPTGPPGVIQTSSSFGAKFENLKIEMKNLQPPPPPPTHPNVKKRAQGHVHYLSLLDSSIWAV